MLGAMLGVRLRPGEDPTDSRHVNGRTGAIALSNGVAEPASVSHISWHGLAGPPNVSGSIVVAVSRPPRDILGRA